MSNIIYQPSVIMPDAKLGDNNKIGAFVFIDNGVVIGNRCRIQNGALLYNGVVIGDDVLIAPNVTTTNDYFPELPVDDWSHRFKPTIIQDRVSIGANATLVCGITIGEGAMIGAGSVVTRSVPPNEVWVGNPAKYLRMK